jgi:hypothetical protein
MHSRFDERWKQFLTQIVEEPPTVETNNIQTNVTQRAKEDKLSAKTVLISSERELGEAREIN